MPNYNKRNFKQAAGWMPNNHSSMDAAAPPNLGIHPLTQAHIGTILLCCYLLLLVTDFTICPAPCPASEDREISEVRWAMTKLPHPHGGVQVFIATSYYLLAGTSGKDICGSLQALFITTA